MSLTSKVIELIKGEVGYIEKATDAMLDSKTANAGAGNYTKYGKWYGWNGVYWCCQFTSWAYEVGGQEGIAPKTASCYAAKEWYIAKGQFHLRDGYVPQKGDQVLFSSDGYPSGGAHTGIVVEFDGNGVRTVEGNTSGGSNLVWNGGCVAEKYYPIGSDGWNRIYGYGTPLWPEELAEVPDTKTEVDDMLTYEQFKEYMDKYNGEVSELDGSSWSQADRDWAIQTGLIVGDGSGKYLWRSDITREAMVTVLHRFAVMHGME